MRFAIVVLWLVVIVIVMYVVWTVFYLVVFTVSVTRAENHRNAIVREAAAFGIRNTADACVTEALAKGNRCRKNDLSCLTDAETFLAWSLPKSADAAAFCAPIPRDPAVCDAWIRDECRRRGKAPTWTCIDVLYGIFEGCPPLPPHRLGSDRHSLD